VKDRLVVKGARRHNLRDISVELPRNALIVFTGISGSGKSRLAFDTMFAEGRRCYVESLSVYIRPLYAEVFQLLRADGFSRVRVAGRSSRSPGHHRWTSAGSTRSTWSWTGSR
jgi:hypothetical protein